MCALLWFFNTLNISGDQLWVNPEIMIIITLFWLFLYLSFWGDFVLKKKSPFLNDWLLDIHWGGGESSPWVILKRYEDTKEQTVCEIVQKSAGGEKLLVLFLNFWVTHICLSLSASMRVVQRDREQNFPLFLFNNQTPLLTEPITKPLMIPVVSKKWKSS